MIVANNYDQTTLSMAAKNMVKNQKLILAQIHEKEIESSTLQNELARIKIDKLNTEAHNLQLSGTLNEHLEQLKETERLIEQRESELRRRDDEIEKKMGNVDRLNRKYNKMMEGVEEAEPLGPLEATIKALTRDTEHEEEEIQRLQRDWLREQTQLIQVIGESEAVQ